MILILNEGTNEELPSLDEFAQTELVWCQLMDSLPGVLSIAEGNEVLDSICPFRKPEFLQQRVLRLAAAGMLWHEWQENGVGARISFDENADERTKCILAQIAVVHAISCVGMSNNESAELVRTILLGGSLSNIDRIEDQGFVPLPVEARFIARMPAHVAQAYMLPLRNLIPICCAARRAIEDNCFDDEAVEILRSVGDRFRLKGAA